MLDVDIRHRFPGFELAARFCSPDSGTTVLFGPSGCGKSTVVEIVCGLLRPETGRVALGGAVLCDTDRRIWVAPERRACGVVFQDARLFPHLSVEGNLRYGLRRAGRHRVGQAGAAAPTIDFDEVTALLGLQGLLGRAPAALSGGERQRVAIGRALLSQPRLLVMDEPLSSLDQARRMDILPYLARLRALALPILYVTHALDELARLADWVVLMADGKVLATDRLARVLGRGDLPLAMRDDAASVLDMRVSAHDTASHLTRLRLDRPSPNGAACLELRVPLVAKREGARLRVRVPAREVIVATTAPEGISVHNIVAGTVRAINLDAVRHAAVVELETHGASLLARITPDAVTRLALAPGNPALALVKAMSIEILDDDRL